MMSATSIRKHLALPHTSWQICVLAIIGGAVSALLVVLFTLTIEEIQQLYLIKRDNYTSLDELSRFDLPIIGALIILIFAWITGYKYLRTGIPFVLHRLKVAHGIIPFRNTLNQFWGSAVALASGFSVGREGPAVHLGAACSSYIGEKLALPYNSIRTLCACGIAAGIAATFNTPIAAVIFVMEVILREYKIHIFIPVMLAALVGSLITSAFFGSSHSLDYFHTISIGQQHYGMLIILAIVLGMLSVVFNRSLVGIIKHSQKLHIITRLMIAAFITGALGYLIPEAMGTDVSSIDFSLANQWQIKLLLGLLLAKFVMTIFALGLGIPGGVIGPILAIGAITGTCIAAITVELMPGAHINSDFALIGMAGFMAATLNAPLAALLTVVELSGQLELVVPAMIVISITSVISGQFFNNRSIFAMQLDVQGLLYRKPPIEESLEKIGVLALLKNNVALVDHGRIKDDSKKTSDLPLRNITSNEQQYYVVRKTITEQTSISQGYDYFLHEEHPAIGQSQSQQLVPLSHQATLAEAYMLLKEQRCGGVYIYTKNKNDYLGIVTFEQIKHYLLEGKLVL